MGKCVQGKLQEGICICNYGYEGDYCDKIVCHHGYPGNNFLECLYNILDRTNNLESCICPPRHRGTYCDECFLKEDSLLSNVYIIPYPNCTIETISQRARISREKTDNRIYSRLIILLVTISLIIFFAIIMLIMHWGRNRDIDPNLNLAEKIERTKMLESAIFQSNGVQDNRRYFNF